MRPQFIYFDMGNVVLNFSHERMAQQMARVAGIEPAAAAHILFTDKVGLEWVYERGELTRDQFYARFCQAAGSRPNIDELDAAANDIFEIKVPTLGPIGRLAAAGYRLGIASNTTYSHWTYCLGRFRALRKAFSVYAMSYELEAMKPDIAFYQGAARLAQTPPEGIFFVDDRPENVAGAQAAGWDAVVYESASQLSEELRKRGVLINY
jgi:glucose-1-phosphatase